MRLWLEAKLQPKLTELAAPFAGQQQPRAVGMPVVGAGADPVAVAARAAAASSAA